VLEKAGLKMLLSEAFLMCYDGQAYLGYSEAGRILQKALLKGLSPAIWHLLKNSSALARDKMEAKL
jgi:hypothetical protein